MLFARAPVGGRFVTDVLPSMILLGFGAGVAFNPVLLAAMGDVEPQDSGLASGIVNTSFMMGGALGLAVLASLAASRTSHLLASGHSHAGALDGGYHVAFLVGALFAVIAATLAAVLLREKSAAAATEMPSERLFRSRHSRTPAARTKPVGTDIPRRRHTRRPRSAKA